MLNLFHLKIGQFRFKYIQSNLSRLNQIDQKANSSLIKDKQIVKIPINFLIDQSYEFNPTPSSFEYIQQIESISDNWSDNHINNEVDTEDFELFYLHLILEEFVLPLCGLGYEEAN